MFITFDRNDIRTKDRQKKIQFVIINNFYFRRFIWNGQERGQNHVRRFLGRTLRGGLRCYTWERGFNSKFFYKLTELLNSKNSFIFFIVAFKWVFWVIFMKNNKFLKNRLNTNFNSTFTPTNPDSRPQIRIRAHKSGSAPTAPNPTSCTIEW